MPGLAAEGIAARVEGLASGRLARRAQLEACAGFDVVVLARKLLVESDLARLRRAARALVFDFDDAVSERPWDVRAQGGSWTRPRRFVETLRTADLVVAGSVWLRDLARALAPQSAPERFPRVRVLPAAVALPSRAPLARSAGDGRSGDAVSLLWTGSRATLGYLEERRRVLAALAGRRPRVELVVLADRRPGDLGIATRFVPFSIEAEDAALARADVGLMPLGSDPWSRGKCGLKLARYLAWGVPAVSSRFGAGAELVDAPSTGLLADDDGEWLAALEKLVDSPARRHAMGLCARADAAARLSLDARVRSWAGVLREAGAIGARRALSI